MRISTEINSTARIVGEAKAIEYIAKAGFEAWDFSMFRMWSWNWTKGEPICVPHPLNGSQYLKFARDLKKIGLDNGIICNQSHAPFPSFLCGTDYLKRSIECTAEAGGAVCVIHPNNDWTDKKNADLYHSLLPFAKEHNVKIAAENMWNLDTQTQQIVACSCSTPKRFNHLLNEVNDTHLVACLDIGHAELRGLNTGAVEMITALGDRLQALHVHDVDFQHDNHQIPFSLCVDFQAVINALKENGYKGDMTLEADNYLTAYDESNVFDGVCNLAESAKRLKMMFLR